MGRFCKTCRFLEADKDKRQAACTYWQEWAKTAVMPWGRIGGPIFQPMTIFPRHVWDDLPRAPELDGIDTSASDGPWSEVMDCPTWEPPQ